MNTFFGKSSAILSDDRKYRYRLTRVWDDNLPRICFCMLNPSIADENTNDPTIRKVIGFARLWGFGSVNVVNLFAYRATKPIDLVTAGGYAVSGFSSEPGFPFTNLNDSHIVSASDGLRLVVAWGKLGNQLNRAAELICQLGKTRKLECLGTNKNGTPKHPLYVKGTTRLQPYRLP